MVKLNTADECETIMVRLSETKTPIAFKHKLNELMSEGAFDNEQDARDFINQHPIDLELYYEEGKGLFAVESEAVECCEIYSPYTSEICENADDC